MGIVRRIRDLCQDYRLQCERRNLFICVVFSGLLTVTCLTTTICFALIYQHYVHSQHEVASACLMTASMDVLVKLNEKVNPCENWAQFSCGGFMQSTQLNWMESSQPAGHDEEQRVLLKLIHKTEHRLYNIFSSDTHLLGLDEDSESATALNSARCMFHSCVHTANASEDTLVSTVLRYLLPLAKPSTSDEEDIEDNEDVIYHEMYQFWRKGFPAFLHVESSPDMNGPLSCSKKWFIVNSNTFQSSPDADSAKRLCVSLLKPLLQLQVTSTEERLRPALELYLQSLESSASKLFNQDLLDMLVTLRYNLTRILSFHEDFSHAVLSFYPRKTHETEGHLQYQSLRNYLVKNVSRSEDLDDFVRLIHDGLLQNNLELVMSEELPLLHQVYSFLRNFHSKNSSQGILRHYFLLDTILRVQLALPKQSTAFQTLVPFLEPAYLPPWSLSKSLQSDVMFASTYQHDNSSSTSFSTASPPLAPRSLFVRHLCTKLVAEYFQDYLATWQKLRLQARRGEPFAVTNDISSTSQNSSSPPLHSITQGKLNLVAEIVENVQRVLENSIRHCEWMQEEMKQATFSLLISVSNKWLVNHSPQQSPRSVHWNSSNHSSSRENCLPKVEDCHTCSLAHFLFRPLQRKCSSNQFRRHIHVHEMYGSPEDFPRVLQLLSSGLLGEQLIEDLYAPDAIHYARIGYLFALDFTSQLDGAISRKAHNLSQSECVYLLRTVQCTVAHSYSWLMQLHNNDSSRYVFVSATQRREFYTRLFVKHSLAITAAYSAYTNRLGTQNKAQNMFSSRGNHYSDEQLFFMTLSQLWCVAPSTAASTALRASGGFRKTSAFSGGPWGILEQEVLAREFFHIYPSVRSTFHCPNATLEDEKPCNIW